MTIVDHLFVVLLIVIPLIGARSYRRYVAAARQGDTVSRPRLYMETQLLQWFLFAVLAGLWLTTGRSLAELGLVSSTAPLLWLAVLISVLITAFLLTLMYFAAGWDAERKRAELKSVGDLVYYLPASRPDLRHFALLSMTAGIVEELIFRGFLIWYFTHVTNVWSAVFLSSLVFAVGHSYQGGEGMLRVFGIGIVFAVLYVLSGSLWLPMILHVLVDVIQGATMLTLHGTRPPLESRTG